VVVVVVAVVVDDPSPEPPSPEPLEDDPSPPGPGPDELDPPSSDPEPEPDEPEPLPEWPSSDPDPLPDEPEDPEPEWWSSPLAASRRPSPELVPSRPLVPPSSPRSDSVSAAAVWCLPSSLPLPWSLLPPRP
jgi:hypothetical protein